MPLLIATPVLRVAVVWLSNNRRGTIVQLSIGTVLLLVIVRRVVLPFEEAIVAMSPRPEGQEAARAVTEQLRGGLFEATATVIIVALAVLAIALLMGPYRWAVALRKGVVQLGSSVWDAGGRLASGSEAHGVVACMTEHARRSRLVEPCWSWR